MKSLLIFILIVYSQCVFGQKNDFIISVFSNYTTDAKIYLAPYASDPFIRNDAVGVGSFSNFSFLVGYYIDNDIVIALGLDYIKVLNNKGYLTVIQNFETKSVPMKDGFQMYPLEASLIYILPFSTNHFKFSMYGGGGIYFGNHLREVGQTSVTNVGQKLNFGVHVGTDMSYYLVKNVALVGGMKFRDPQVTVKSKYNQREIIINGQQAFIAQESFDSKINIDGLTFYTGIKIHLNPF